MPTDEQKAQLEAFWKESNARSRIFQKQKNTDDIIQFIRRNWKLWTDDYETVKMSVEQLYRDQDVSIEHLAMLIGIPERVFFKRIKKEDAVKAWLDFPKSSLFDVFMRCVDMHKSAEACLFAVYGQKALVITNMQTSYLPGKMHLFFKSARNAKDIHLFDAGEAAERMNLFNHF